ncbi:MAG: hypothetical protein GY707_19495, partial [Desulfobacteraceae bacterium]|nr:hypothetical protein [Desulfobacteraceae bacterium]
MATSNLFSKRQKKLRGDLPDVYTYNNIPNALRVQIVHIWEDALGSESEYDDTSLPVEKTYRLIVGTLCREYGMFTLASYFRDDERDFKYELKAFFLAESDIERLIDVIESSFRTIDRLTRKYSYRNVKDFDKRADRAIKELNTRFREHGIGYKFEDGMIVRIDSELIHSKVVKPALRILSRNHFKEAQLEFLKANDYYRKEDHKKALKASLSAFKATIRAICNKNKWKYDPGADSKSFIKICLAQNLIPVFWQSQINSLASILENGVPTKLAESEKDSASMAEQDHVVAYVLNMTASVIVFLGESD